MRLTVQFASGHKTKCDFFISLDRPSALRWSVERADVDVNAPYLGVPRQAASSKLPMVSYRVNGKRTMVIYRCSRVRAQRTWRVGGEHMTRSVRQTATCSSPCHRVRSPCSGSVPAARRATFGPAGSTVMTASATGCAAKWRPRSLPTHVDRAMTRWGATTRTSRLPHPARPDAKVASC